MKRCPQCSTTYSDPTLFYCLADGTPLIEASDEQQTVVRPGRGDALRVEIPQEMSAGEFRVPQQEPASRGNFGGIAAVVGVICLIGIVAVAGAGALIYFNRDARREPTNSDANRIARNVSPTPSPSPTKDETADLKNKIANLERKINDQKNTNPAVNNASNVSATPATSTAVRRVNSPGDGFLALRSEPNSSNGFRVATIPHGTMITVGGCLSQTRIGNRSGRWCRASYGGYSGWVFDAWLDY